MVMVFLLECIDELDELIEAAVLRVGHGVDHIPVLAAGPDQALALTPLVLASALRRLGRPGEGMEWS